MGASPQTMSPKGDWGTATRSGRSRWWARGSNPCPPQCTSMRKDVRQGPPEPLGHHDHLSGTDGAPLRCSTCSGRGNKTCATCKGEKKLLHFLQLVIVWYVAPLNAMAWRGGLGGHGLDWFLQRSSTWLGLSQCRDLLGETESQGPKAPRQGSSHALRVSPIGYLARTELSVLY